LEDQVKITLCPFLQLITLYKRITDVIPDIGQGGLTPHIATLWMFSCSCMESYACSYAHGGIERLHWWEFNDPTWAQTIAPPQVCVPWDTLFCKINPHWLNCPSWMLS